MFGVIKKIFRKSSPSHAASTPRSLAPTREDDVNPFALQGETNPSLASTPVIPPDPTDCLAVSYKAILRQLPKELYGKNSPGEGQIFSVAKSRVIEQLAQGTVKVPFGELRRAAPLGIFVGNSAHDGKLVDLPLKEILGQLQPEAFVRRSQQRVEVPDDVGDLFGTKGERLAPLRVLEKNDLPKSAPASSPTPSIAVRPAAIPTARRTLPAAPMAAPAAKAATKPSLSPPISAPQIAGQKASISTPLPKPAPLPKTPSAALPKPAIPASQPVVSDGNQLLAPLKDIAQSWPEAVRNEIADLDLTNATCAFPVNEIGQALKQGVIHYSWQQILAFIKSAPSLSPSIHGETILPLPLHIIAPLYMARGTEPEQKRISVGEDIPDLFMKRQAPGPAKRPAAAAVPLEGPPAVTPSAVSSPAAASPPIRPPAASGSPTLAISLSSVSANWPEAIRKEITQFRLTDTTLELPLDAVEGALKAGKVEYVWKQICNWLKPCPAEVLSSSHAETPLALPLHVLAPLFLQRRPTQQPRKSAAQINIPDLFSSLGEQLTTSVPEESTPAPPAPPPPAVALPKLADNLAELFGEPDKKNWTPNEIVHKTSMFPGVSGALIALQDGLLVASCMPPTWKTETIAAFLPQIFGRMKQYAKELKMGELTSVSFAVDQGALQIFNAGIIYFAALGKPDAPLPSAHLNLIATELSRHTK